MDKLGDMSKKYRRSGVELLKIIAIYLIVLSHVTQSLYSKNVLYSSDYLIDITHSTKNVQQLLLILMSSSGGQGNLIFIVCSSWFLLDSNNIDSKKIVHLIADVWMINFIYLLIFLFDGKYNLLFKDIVSVLFPNIFSVNWFITCYILFYLIHPYLNSLILKCSQRELLVVDIILFTLYFLLNYAIGGLFFESSLILFVSIYFIVAYVKMYLPNYCKKIRMNYVTLMIGILGIPILTLLTNILGLHIVFFTDKMTHWISNYSPFLLLTAISLFNIFNNHKYKSEKINYISSLSLLVYIVHDNLLFRKYMRPQIWMYIYEHIGYKQIVFVTIIFSMFLFLVSVFLALIYKIIFQKKIYRIAEINQEKIIKLFNMVCEKILEKN